MPPITGLVVTTRPGCVERVARALAARSDVSIGNATDRALAVATDTPTLAADRRLLAWIGDLPGVVQVDIAFVDFSDVHGGHTGDELSPGGASRRRFEAVEQTSPFAEEGGVS
jgi:nitrate reductase NapAB chaperone NapD